MRKSLFVQTFGAVLGAALLAGLVTYVLASRSVAQRVEELTRDELSQRVSLLERLFAPQFPTERSPELQDRVRGLGQDLDARLTLLTPDGTVLADSGKDPAATDNHLHRPEFQQALRNGAGSSLRRSDTLGKEMLYFARRLGPAEAPLGFLRAGRPLLELQHRQDELLHSLLLAEGMAVVVSLLLAWGLARRIARPLGALTQTAAAIASGDLRQRARPAGTREVEELARAFNTMTERVEQDLATIQQDRRELMAILSSMVEGVIALDDEGRIALMNDAAGEMLGVDAQRSRGQALWVALRLPSVPETLADAMRAGEPKGAELHLVRDGRERTLRLTVSPLASSHETTQGAVLLLRDITQARQLEIMRRDFVANASHELKTPVSAVRALAETILDDAEMEPEVSREFVRRIHAQSERLATLVQELLTLSRLEAGDRWTDAAPSDLRVSLQEAIESCTPLATSLGVTLSTHSPTEPLRVAAAAEALRRIAGNLLDNAIKYSPPGGTVAITLAPSAQGVELRIRDQGPGIAQVHHERVFERFYRVDEGRSREAGGTGLGLAIVKHLVLSLGGQITVDSSPGRGSEFRVWLPLAAT